MKKLFGSPLFKRVFSPALALAAIVMLSLFAPRGMAMPADGDATATPETSTVSPSVEPTRTPEPTPADTPTPAPTPVPSPTPEPPPADFLTADFSGKDAPVLERLFGAWGFRYYQPDGKWTDEDAYQLRLFQRWANLPATGRPDNATKLALSDAWQRYQNSKIPRTILPLEGRYIGINAGHQQRADSRKEALSPERRSPKRARVSGGTRGVATRIPEYQTNLAVALKLRARLEAMGARVLMARTVNNVRISNAERARMMNSAHVDVYFSIHCNGNRNRRANGLETLVPKGRGYQTGAVLARSKRLSTCIQTELIRASGARNLGYSYRRDLSSLNWSAVPTCLVELGYMTNPAEDKRLNSAGYQDKLVSGMVNGFVSYFSKN